MPTVTFSNGKSATFDQMPTPEDIDFVAKQIGVTPDQSGGGEKPAGAQGDHSWTTGDKHYIPQLGDAVLGDPTKKENQGAFRSALRPILNLPTSLARGLEDATKVIPSAVNLAKEGGITNLGRGALEVAKNVSGFNLAKGLGDTVLGGINAGVNKITGAPQGSSDQDRAYNTAKNVITHPLDTATSVAEGIYNTSQENPMVIPLVLDAAGKALNKAGVKSVGPINTSDVISSVAKPIVEPAKAAIKYATAPLRDAAFNKRVEEFSKILNPSKGLAATESRYEKNSPEMAAQLEREGTKLNFDKDARGRLDTTAAQESVGSIAERDNATLGKLLETSGTSVNLDDMADVARAEAKRFYKGTAQDSALAHIDEEMAAYRKQYSGQGYLSADGRFQVPSQVANEIKKDLWSKSKFPPFGSGLDQTKAGTSNIMGHAIKDGIETQIGQDNLVGRLNKRLGDIQSLQTMLQKSQGGAVHGGFMTRLFGRAVGGMAGSFGGPIGTITGAITGDLITAALNDPDRPLSWAQAVLSRAEAETPQLLREVEARIGKNSQDILNRKLLTGPAPEGTIGNPRILQGKPNSMAPAVDAEGNILGKPAENTPEPTGLYGYFKRIEDAQKAVGYKKPSNFGKAPIDAKGAKTQIEKPAPQQVQPVKPSPDATIRPPNSKEIPKPPENGASVANAIDFSKIEPFIKLGRNAAKKAGVLDEYDKAIEALKASKKGKK